MCQLDLKTQMNGKCKDKAELETFGLIVKEIRIK